jgi:hypothetical protein
MTCTEHLKELKACPDGLAFSEGKTAKEVWESCDRIDWLFWWATKTTVNTKQDIVLAACKCARTSLQYAKIGEERPRLAIEAAEAWCIDPSGVNAKASKEAADAAAYAAAYAYASSADAAAAAARKISTSEMCDIIRSILKQPWFEV